MYRGGKTFLQSIYTWLLFFCITLRAYHFMQTTMFQFTSIYSPPVLWLALDVAYEAEFLIQVICLDFNLWM